MIRVLPAQRVVVLRPVLGVYTTAEPGETLIPHLFDWYFDGIDDFIYAPLSSGISARGDYSFAVRFTALSITLPPSRSVLAFAESPTQIWSFVFHAHNNTYFILRSDGSTGNYYLGVSPILHVWLDVAYTFGSSVNAYANGELIRTYTRLLEADMQFIGVLLGAEMTTGSGLFFGRISYSALYRVFVPQSIVSDLHIRRVVDSSNLSMFLDPTFYDGTKYLDLSGNNNHGYPYGGAARVPASITWLWRVRGLYSGDKVRVLVPPMTRYRVGRGDWQVNGTWSVVELLLDPGLVSLVFEGLL